MSQRILITGGAGFIGSHLADELLAQGFRVAVLDSLAPQVHRNGGRPAYLSPEIELIDADVRDPDALRRAVSGADAVYHFAAMVGVGQSMYQVDDYVAVNDLGTANLLQALIEKPVGRLVVASSMSIYGEGLYRDADGNAADDVERDAAAARRGEWEPRDAAGRRLRPVATPEGKRPSLASIYALSKFVQERMCLMVGQAYGIPTVALRFFNVYGTRQALSNPYTGVLAIFASRLLNRRRPLIFEDGLQRRDFVHVADVARACRLALEVPGAAGRVFNVGSGRSYTVNEIGQRLAACMGLSELAPEVTGRYRTGDIRHCFADISLGHDILGYRPQVDLETGLQELVDWVAGEIADDQVERANRELASRGLVA